MTKKLVAPTFEVPPWPFPIQGSQGWILLDEISVRCLAEGIVTGRLEQQARQIVAGLEPSK